MSRIPAARQPVENFQNPLGTLRLQGHQARLDALLKQKKSRELRAFAAHAGRQAGKAERLIDPQRPNLQTGALSSQANRLRQQQAFASEAALIAPENPGKYREKLAREYIDRTTAGSPLEVAKATAAGAVDVERIKQSELSKRQEQIERGKFQALGSRAVELRQQQEYAANEAQRNRDAQRLVADREHDLKLRAQVFEERKFNVAAEAIISKGKVPVITSRDQAEMILKAMETIPEGETTAEGYAAWNKTLEMLEKVLGRPTGLRPRGAGAGAGGGAGGEPAARPAAATEPLDPNNRPEGNWEKFKRGARAYYRGRGINLG